MLIRKKEYLQKFHCGIESNNFTKSWDQDMLVPINKNKLLMLLKLKGL